MSRSSTVWRGRRGGAGLLAAIGIAAAAAPAPASGQSLGQSREARATGSTGPGGAGPGTQQAGTSQETATVALPTASTSPRKHVFANGGRARFSYMLNAPRALNLVVEIVRKADGAVVRTINRPGAEPGVLYRLGWAGIDSLGHRARVGTYYFRVRRAGSGKLVKPLPDAGRRWINFYWSRFPVLGPHTYGDSIGAPRSGHTHQGQDIFADCGAPIVAAIGGRVQYTGYQAGGAGHYAVIDGRDQFDYVYMHLAPGVKVGTGQTVRTGDPIGANGQTGNASGCHLHFEIWDEPGWYEGGDFINPTAKMRYWDTYS